MYKDNKIKTEQAKELYTQSPIVLIATLFIVVIVIFSFENRIENSLLIPWALWIVMLTIIRAYSINLFHKKKRIESPHYWLILFTLFSFLSGLSWGVLLLHVLAPISGNEILVLSFILTGMVAGALLPLSSYLPAYFAFSAPMFIPFSITMFNLETSGFSGTGFLVLTFLISMLAFSTLVNRNILMSIKLRLNNVTLLQDLNTQKELVDVANREKSRFLVATSHDLRQPLYALNLYLGALRAALKYPNQLDLLDKAKLSSDALSDLLNALMDVSKFDSGGVQVMPSVFDLRSLIERTCIEYEQYAEEKNIKVKTNLGQVSVNTDPILLGRMIRNLISNALNHNENCCLLVSTKLSDGQVTIEISDNGKGIPDSELTNIFSEFYQLNNPERDRNKGLGLGLAIVKRLSDLLAIPVSVESEVAKGTTFSLTLAIEKRKNPRLETVVSADNLNLAGLFIIVIDDEKDVRDATKSLLRSWGCEVLISSSQLDLMMTLSQDNYPVPDLVISDYRLKDKLHGIDAASAVLNHFNVKVPVLIVTGDSSIEIVSHIEKTNYHQLLKPVSSDTLRQKMESILVA